MSDPYIFPEEEGSLLRHIASGYHSEGFRYYVSPSAMLDSTEQPRLVATGPAAVRFSEASPTIVQYAPPPYPPPGWQQNHAPTVSQIGHESMLMMSYTVYYGEADDFPAELDGPSGLFNDGRPEDHGSQHGPLPRETAGPPLPATPSLNVVSSSTIPSTTSHKATTRGRRARPSSELIEAKCTIRDQSGEQCNADLQYQERGDRRSLLRHLREAHGVTTTKTKDRKLQGPLVLCPSEECYCRHTQDKCSQRDELGRWVRHRTHVVDLLRHYMDIHLEPVVPETQRNKCKWCGRGFSRPDSVTRHQNKSCHMRFNPSHL